MLSGGAQKSAVRDAVSVYQDQFGHSCTPCLAYILLTYMIAYGGKRKKAFFLSFQG
ncbi:hypothetical protein LJK88_34915 [Paenibacillus sp. P26]|nr:hypothetical protein LJK88_34915 [Paenibacillus sp. P26]